jgi:hypothetical protein
MATGKLTDAGTHNTFWDAFHRQFNNLNGDLWRSQSDATITNHVYTGIGLGNVRGRQEEWQTDVPGSPGNYQNAWLWGPSDGTAGQQTWILEDILNGINRLSIGQQTTAGGNNQTAINGAGSGAVLLNASNGAGTGGVIIGSGGATSTQVAAFDSSGNESLDGAVQWYNGTTLTYEWECASLTSCTLQNANATTPGRVFKSNVNGQTDLDSEGSTDVTINNTSTGGTGGFSVYAGGPTYYNTNVFAIQPNGSGGAFYKFPTAKSVTGYGCAHFDNSGYLTNTGTDCGTGSGSGSVTSVALSLPAQFSVSGSPITSSGTFTVSWASQAGHSFFAGLDGSGSGTPAFRTIAADDVPTLNQSTSGNAATATASNHSPTQCSSGLYSQGDTTGWAANCATVQYSQLGGSVPTWNQSTTGNAATATTTTGNAATATALAATPGQCSSGNYATGIAAAGTANCGAVQYSQLGGTVTTWNQNTTGTAAGITQAASIHIDNSAGANYVCINCDNNTGTSGFVVQNGTGSSPTTEFQVTGSGNTTATGFLASKGWFGNYAATFTAGAAAGSSPTIGCLSGHTCTNIQGTVSIHTGTATTTGTIVTVNFNHTQNNDLDCATDFQLAGTGHLTTYDATSSTSGLVIATDGFTPAASTTYTLTYTCGSY